MLKTKLAKGAPPVLWSLLPKVSISKLWTFDLWMWFPILISLWQWKSPAEPKLCPLVGSELAQGVLPCSPKSALHQPEQLFTLGGCFPPPAWLLLSDGAEFTANPGCWHQEYDSPYPATDIFKSSGWWPELPEAVTNCLMMTQMTGSNFSPAAGSQAGMTCLTIAALHILVKGRPVNSPGVELLPQVGYIERGVSFLVVWNILCSGHFFRFKHVDLFSPPSHFK